MPSKIWTKSCGCCSQISRYAEILGKIFTSLTGHAGEITEFAFEVRLEVSAVDVLLVLGGQVLHEVGPLGSGERALGALKKKTINVTLHLNF